MPNPDTLEIITQVAHPSIREKRVHKKMAWKVLTAFDDENLCMPICNLQICSNIPKFAIYVHGEKKL